MHGACRVCSLAKILCPDLDCRWVPSLNMPNVAQKRYLGMDVAIKPSGVAMANIVWLLMYLLQASVSRLVPGSKKEAQQAQDQALNLLGMLTRRAANFEDPIRTAFGQAHMQLDGALSCDNAWQQHVMPHQAMLTALGSTERGGPPLHDMQSLAATMWRWARLVHVNAPGRRNKSVPRLCQEILTACLAHVSNKLARWSVSQEECSTAVLIATQPKGKRTSPGLLSRLMRKQNKRMAVRNWQQDGLQVDTRISSLESKSSAFYLQSTRSTFQKEAMVELVLDSTMMATRDLQAHIGHACRINLSVYLPPVILRHLRWRDSVVGAKVSGEDLETFAQSGFRTGKKQQIRDFIQSINHVLTVGFNKDLCSFFPLAKLEPLSSGEVRYWPDASQRFVRTPSSGSGKELERQVPELPDEFLEITKVPVLLITIDQKQSQWTACQFLARIIMLAFREDVYHRSWQDFLWAMGHAVGSFTHTAVQMNFACNVNYQPFGQGGHLAKRRELIAEWERLFPTYGPEFETLCHQFSLDARKPLPRSSSELQSWCEKLILDNKDYENTGDLWRQSSWFSILKLLNKYDSVFHARRFQAQEIANRFVLQNPRGKELVASVAETVTKAMTQDTSTGLGLQSNDAGKEQHLAEMRQLRKKAGNALLLAPRLMHTANLVNSRIMLLVGKVAWSEQTWWSVSKTTCSADRDVSVMYASSLGEDMLKHTWRTSVCDAEELARLGIQAVPGQIPGCVIPGSLTGLGRHQGGERRGATHVVPAALDGGKILVICVAPVGIA